MDEDSQRSQEVRRVYPFDDVGVMTPVHQKKFKKLLVVKGSLALLS